MEKRVIIFGNSSSGKSTIAKKIAKKYELAYLDLDIIAWAKSATPQRKPIQESKTYIDQFIQANSNWVIEGCYSDLIKLAAPKSTEAIYMSLSIDSCIQNAKDRPWEPHKYESKAAQDKNLEMLINWIKGYSKRADTFSQDSHNELFENYPKLKRIISQRKYEI